jgi:hypothetical protein
MTRSPARPDNTRMAVTPRVKSGPNQESKGSASIIRGSAMHNPLTRVQSAVRVTTNCFRM